MWEYGCNHSPPARWLRAQHLPRLTSGRSEWRYYKKVSQDFGSRGRCRAGCKEQQVIVVGGGAAGLTAAYFAAKEGAKVLILEKTAEAGKKILISGGKRCNVLPMDVDLERDYFTESSGSAMRAIFSQWSLPGCQSCKARIRRQNIAQVNKGHEAIGTAYVLETLGAFLLVIPQLWQYRLEDDVGLKLASDESSSKYFPASDSAGEVRDRLLAGCLEVGASIRYDASLAGLARHENSWVCQLANNSSVQGSHIVMATGGKSFPVMGTDGRGMHLLAEMGHTLSRPYPALTPLRGTHMSSRQLAGLSVYNARVWCEGGEASRKSKRRQMARAERSAMLFTHRGFSGPAILDLSHHLVKAWDRGSNPPGLRVNWTDEEASVWEGRFRNPGSRQLLSLLKQHGLPSRLAEALLHSASADQQHSLLERKVADLTRLERAEVTGGGVKLNDINCATMQSRITPGIFLCGEVLDMFGRIGGFNFYWAWLTGRQAGLGAAKSQKTLSNMSAV